MSTVERSTRKRIPREDPCGDVLCDHCGATAEDIAAAARSESHKRPKNGKANGQTPPNGTGAVNGGGKVRLITEVVEAIDLDPALIDPSPYQPRQSFPEEEIEKLAQNMRTLGQLQPILCRQVGGRYELVDGERRWRASKVAGLTRIRAEVRALGDAEARAIVIASAVHRQDLNAIEEARAFRQMIDAGDVPGPTELARHLGLSQGQVSNRLRLLELPEKWQKRIISREIPPSHARILVPFARYPKILEAIEDELSVWEFGKRQKGLDIGPVRDFEQRCLDAADRATSPMTGEPYEFAAGKRVPVFTPTAEQRAELGIVEIPGPDGKLRERATNVVLWERLRADQVVAIKQRKEKAAARAAKKPTEEQKAQMSPADRKRIEEEDRKKRAERAKQDRKRLWQLVTDWRRYLIARWLLAENTLGQLFRLGLFMGCYPVAKYRDDRDEAFRLVMGGNQHGAERIYKSVAGLADGEAEQTMAKWLAACFWTEEGGPMEMVDAQIVAAIAADLEISEEAWWAEEFMGPFSEAYFVAKTKDQLVELGGELGLDLPAGGKKDDLVARFMAKKPGPDDMEAGLPFPKEIKKIKAPR